MAACVEKVLALSGVGAALVAACSRGIALGPLRDGVSDGAGGALATSSAATSPAALASASTKASSTMASASATTSAATGAANSSASSVASSAASTSASSSSGMSCPPLASPPGACLSPGCPFDATPCLAAKQQWGASVFALRVAHLTVAAPASIANGVLGTVLDGAITPNVQTCNLKGSATFSWLLQFDLGALTITTGGAKPGAGISGPFAFVEEDVTFDASSFHVAPATVAAAFAGCAIDSSAAADVRLPLYLNAQGSSMILLPLHQLRFSGGFFTSDHSCIGAYNAAGLDPSQGCAPDAQHPLYVDGGRTSGYFALDESDRVTVAPLGESLCLLLSGDPSQYGDLAQPVAHCKRGPNNDLLFQGDWCAATDQPATPACHDALHFSATFAASGVDLN
jgi:hypothetical protein